MANSNELKKALAKRLSKRRLFYVCRDAERAVGDGLELNNYVVITNQTDFSKKLADQTSHIILIKDKNQLDTAELLEHPETKKIIRAKDFVLVFKNNAIIEHICRKNKWQLLNPSAQLADRIESKISQVAWLGKLNKHLPPHKIDTCKNIKWHNKQFILQFNHSHTGSGTFLIKSKKELENLQKKFPQRLVRVMNYIDGPVFTNNNIVWGNKVLIGNISYQITGLPPFTENKFSTIGNDWNLPHKLLNKNPKGIPSGQIKQYKKIVTEIGKKLNRDGWKGLFGVDIIMDKKSGKLYLLEINARQPASTTFESQLQHLLAQDEGRITTFIAHFTALLGLNPANYKLIQINNGAQIVQRVTKNITKINKVNIQGSHIINTIEYKNNSLGSDLVRIQCDQGLMQKHNTLNKLGKKIQASVC